MIHRPIQLDGAVLQLVIMRMLLLHTTNGHYANTSDAYQQEHRPRSNRNAVACFRVLFEPRLDLTANCAVSILIGMTFLAAGIYNGIRHAAGAYSRLGSVRFAGSVAVRYIVCKAVGMSCIGAVD